MHFGHLKWGLNGGFIAAMLPFVRAVLEATSFHWQIQELCLHLVVKLQMYLECGDIDESEHQ